MKSKNLLFLWRVVGYAVVGGVRVNEVFNVWGGEGTTKIEQVQTRGEEGPNFGHLMIT